ncbi:putative glycolipid permease LtaA [Paenibacillus baekrokdamisoli]|uniref:Putative glycolipid permease LtaA n=1 Tax=Paenibacillus baekrokdamisoli TaxID=1712516 RepID=A0A3G9IND9_9BACL|nr:MFS transporter [Paenibacillus baekrokdamisoli]MBB3067068.1 MFS family permease [Paenibacillus baekrokdamisoli]BBH19742.1 putative glycolipid permease LtaA [Paenibacillus baekrokdamisoli]
MDIANESVRLRIGLKNNFRRLALALFFAEFIRGALLVVLLPSYGASHLGFSLSIIGTAVSLHYLIDSFIKGFVGYLLDKLSPRLVLNVGFLLSALGIGLLMTAPNVWVFLTGAGLVGAGFSPLWLMCLGQVEEESRAAQMGKLYIYWLAGLGLGPVSIGYMIDIGYGTAFAAIFCLCFIGWMISGMTAITMSANTEDKVTLRQQLTGLWRRMSKGGFLLPGMLLQTLAGGMLVPVLSSFVAERLAFSHTQFSILLMTGGACVIGLLIPMGKLFDRFGGKWFLAGGFGAFALALYGLTQVTTFLAAEALTLGMGVAYAALLPAWNTLMASYVPENSKGMGWGIFSSVEGLGVVFGPLLGSWLASGGHLSRPFMISAFLFAVIGIVYAFSPSRLYRNGAYRGASGRT